MLGNTSQATVFTRQEVPDSSGLFNFIRRSPRHVCAQCFVPRLKFKKKTPPFLLLQNFNRSLTKYFTRSIVAIKLQLKLLQNSFNNFLIRFELKRILFSIDSNFSIWTMNSCLRIQLVVSRGGGKGARESRCTSGITSCWTPLQDQRRTPADSWYHANCPVIVTSHTRTFVRGRLPPC